MIILVEWICCIGRRFKHNNQITVISAFEIKGSPPTSYSTPLFNKQVKVVLQEGKVVTGYDILVKNNIISTYPNFLLIWLPKSIPLSLKNEGKSMLSVNSKQLGNLYL